MSESSDIERELPASEQKIRKAREEGNVPRSRELSSGMLLLGIVVLFIGFGGHFTAAMSNMMQSSFSLSAAQLQEEGMMTRRLFAIMLDGLLLLTPVMAAAVFFAIASPGAIGGFNYSEKQYEFKFSRLNPISGLAKLFTANAAFELFKSIIKVVVIGAIGWKLLSSHMSMYPALIGLTIDEGIGMAGQRAIWDAVFMSLAFFVIVAIDAPYQLWKYYNDLRMSLQEVKDEAKESEGDPMLKGRIRQMQRERARSRMMAKVASADVVVTNPTHYSVALSYSEGLGRAPVVVAKGAGEVALKIRELAKENNVPMMEMPPLARALYAHVDLDHEIPSTLFTAVAKLLAYIMTMKNGAIDATLFPQVDDIPQGMDPGPGAA